MKGNSSEKWVGSLDYSTSTDIQLAGMAYSGKPKALANAVKTDPNQGRILAAAVKHGYITSGELNTVATTLGMMG